ncbi:MAG: Gfo/Idh/MocA family protein, partial [Nitrososphaerales archaeon]
MNRQVKIGIIGAGRWARIHARAYSKMPDAVIVGVAGKNMLEAQEFAKELKVDYYYENFTQLLQNPEIDAVSVVVPPKYFPQVVIEAAYNGKHILCEKPLALTLAEASKIYYAVEKNGVKLQVGFDRRFNPLMVTLKSICKEQRYGEPKVIISRRSVDYVAHYHSSPWRFEHEEGGGILTSFCVHDFDLIPWMTGHKITNLMIAGGPLFYGLKAEDCCLTTLTLSNGSLAYVEGSRNLKSSWQFEVMFEDARIEADIANSQLKIHQNGQIKVEQMQKILTVDRSIRAFLDSIINDTTSCTSKEEMLATVR